MFQQVSEAFTWIETHTSPGIRPGLHRMESALARLGNPERRCKFIHVAGTNGKGSTSAMIASVLQAAGYRTGMFVSPSILGWSEQIQIDGKPISEERFLYWANHLRVVIEQMIADGEEAPSPYEFWTLLAICYFALDECPWFIVWETGLGGRLDSTNVVYPLVSVITQIGIDHKEYLGDTIEQIAREKAGIIKQGVPIVIGNLPVEARHEIEKIAEEKKSTQYQHGRDFHAEAVTQTSSKQVIHFHNRYRKMENLPLALVGDHQVENAANALMTLEVLRQNYMTVLTEEDIAKGLTEVRWPGRLEQVADEPMVVLDGAHNQQGVAAISKAISQFYTYDRLILVLATMKEKEANLYAPLVELADHLVLTEVTDNPRSKTSEVLLTEMEALNSTIPMEAFSQVEQAVNFAREIAKPSDLILITGSLYLIAEARPIWMGNR